MKTVTSFGEVASHDATLRETLTALSCPASASRRGVVRALALLGSAGLAASAKVAWSACSVIPSETGGPYPGDGTNGPNVLTQSGIVRQDIRPSFGSAGAATAAGVALTVTLQLVNTNSGCGAHAGYVVYLWHCDALGRYSMYSAGVTAQNYLRGVQVADSNGMVSFTTIFPGCYSGRWPHIHFEIYSSQAAAVSGTNAVRTSQLALPQAASAEVYSGQSAVYAGSTSNLNAISLARDNVFSDTLAATQLATTTGSVATGYNATLEVGIAGAVVANTVPSAPALGSVTIHQMQSNANLNVGGADPTAGAVTISNTAFLEFTAPAQTGAARC